MPITTLDRLALPRLDLIKIDAEGMEIDVLTGATQTIARCRPVMYVEWIKSDSAALDSKIHAYGYDIYVIGGDLLCIPAEPRARFATLLPA